MPRVGNSKDGHPLDSIAHAGSSTDDHPGDIIAHDDNPNDDQPANASQEEEKERRETAWLTLSQSFAALLPPVVFWGVSVIWELLLSVFIPRGKGLKKGSVERREKVDNDIIETETANRRVAILKSRKPREMVERNDQSMTNHNTVDVNN